MSAPEEEMTTDELKALCEGIGIKGSRKNRVLVMRLAKNIGSRDLKKLKIAYKKASLSSH